MRHNVASDISRRGFSVPSGMRRRRARPSASGSRRGLDAVAPVEFVGLRLACLLPFARPAVAHRSLVAVFGLVGTHDGEDVFAGERVRMGFRPVFRDRRGLRDGFPVAVAGRVVQFALFGALGQSLRSRSQSEASLRAESMRLSHQSFAGIQSMTAATVSAAVMRSHPSDEAIRSRSFDTAFASRLVGGFVVSASFPRTTVRRSATARTSSGMAGVVLVLVFLPVVGRFPLAGSSPVGREGLMVCINLLGACGAPLEVHEVHPSSF